MTTWRVDYHRPDPIGTCGRCRRPIEHGQPYAPMVPFVGSWGGFMHANCPGPLTVIRGGAQ